MARAFFQYNKNDQDDEIDKNDEIVHQAKRFTKQSD